MPEQSATPDRVEDRRPRGAHVMARYLSIPTALRASAVS
jgi:hypothetical protein